MWTRSVLLWRLAASIGVTSRRGGRIRVHYMHCCVLYRKMNNKPFSYRMVLTGKTVLSSISFWRRKPTTAQSRPPRLAILSMATSE